MNRARSSHEQRILRESREFFRRVFGEKCEKRRAEEIAALTIVNWKGRRLRAIRCHGVRGKGPHDMNVPESVLWNLVDLDRFMCAFHA